MLWEDYVLMNVIQFFTNTFALAVHRWDLYLNLSARSMKRPVPYPRL